MKIVAFFLLFFVFLTACSSNENRPLPVVSDYIFDSVVEIKDLRVGVVSGPYWDMFEEAVLPSLEEMGYTAKMVYFSDYARPNLALARNDVDLNIFQHYAYLNTFKIDNDMALSAIMEIPTVSMGVFSGRIDSINEIGRGITVSIPDDSSNLARALRVLEAAGVITLNPAIDKSKAVIADIVFNPREIRFTPIPAESLVESMETYDMSVIPGNFAVSRGLDNAKALYNEVLTENYKIVVAVRSDDLHKQFVRDIIDIIYSDSFRDVILEPDGQYIHFQYPRWFHDAMIETR